MADERSDHQILTDVILRGQRPCCDTTADKPHEKTCRNSLEGRVKHFRMQLASQLQACIDDGTIRSTMTVIDAVEELGK